MAQGDIAPIADVDVWRAAKLLIDQHGDGAAIEAMKRADALAAQGDAAGKVTWLRILEAVEELQNTKPSGPVHRTIPRRSRRTTELMKGRTHVAMAVNLFGSMPGHHFVNPGRDGCLEFGALIAEKPTKKHEHVSPFSHERCRREALAGKDRGFARVAAQCVDWATCVAPGLPYLRTFKSHGLVRGPR